MWFLPCFYVLAGRCGGLQITETYWVGLYKKREIYSKDTQGSLNVFVEDGDLGSCGNCSSRNFQNYIQCLYSLFRIPHFQQRKVCLVAQLWFSVLAPASGGSDDAWSKHCAYHLPTCLFPAAGECESMRFITNFFGSYLIIIDFPQ